MLKKIIIDHNNTITIGMDSGYACPMVSISRNYYEKEKYIQSLEFFIWDDISLKARTNISDGNEIQFDFCEDDPLYYPLNRFLESDNEIIIDDDDTIECLKKYVIFKRENDRIVVRCINKTTQFGSIDKYGFFIKNIAPDGRSKIKDYADKLRIVDFYRDLERTLLEEEHQITFDEYMESIRLKRIKKGVF